MKLFAATAALVVTLAGSMLPALARDSYVVDGAAMLKPATVESLNRSIDDFHRQYGKEVVVVTVPTLDGQTAPVVAEKQFAQQQVNGAMLFFAKAEKKDFVVVGRSARRFFPAGTSHDIEAAMRGYLRSGDVDGGVTTGVNLVIDTYRSHARPVGGNVRAYQSSPATNVASTGGFQMGWLLWIAVLVIGFLIVRAIFRAIAGPRVPPGYGGQGYGGGPMGGPGYGPQGYNYGGGGGGGGFFSGLLGGLGGAFIGNELFGGNRDRGFGGGEAGMGGDGNVDNSGFQNDAGQADMGNSSGGDFGGGGGGWGDSGGGDSGGGGGDSGGGW